MHLGRSLLVILILTSTCLTARSQETEESDGENYIDSPDASYADRRDGIGHMLTFGYSWYNPTDYRPDFVTGQDFSSYYEGAETPLVEPRVLLL